MNPALYRPEPRFAELLDGFYDPVRAAVFPRHQLRHRHQPWAEKLGLGGLDDAAWEAHFARFQPLPGNLQVPLALRYHGHQFMVYNPDLGDGRGFLFAQLRETLPDGSPGRLLDLGTKGSGTTPWSRGGDGKLTLKGGVREVLASEMLEALGVDTCKSFSLFETGEALYRGDEPSPTRSSVLVRLSHSHIRFGSFQRHAYYGDTARLSRLLSFAVEHYLPGLAASGSREDVPSAFLRQVTLSSARLVASWTVAGFVHGVLNTDNMNITGESFDYGPYRFLPTYQPGFVAAYFDHSALYCFARQPRAVLWNLEALADALKALAPGKAALLEFEPAFREAVRERLLWRLGLCSAGAERDAALVDAVYDFLGQSQVGMDRFFFDVWGGLASEKRWASSPAAAAYQGESFATLRTRLEAHDPVQPSRLSHPYFQGEAPCSLLVDEINDVIWKAIDAHDDWGPFDAKVAQIRKLARVLDTSCPAPN
jgi:uncharacterized protein YdiU (UPF0061 family)